MRRVARDVEIIGAFLAGAMSAVAAARVQRRRRAPRPCVRPCDDVEVAVNALGERHPAIPQLVHGRLVVPLRNDSPAVAGLVVAEVETDGSRQVEVLRSMAPFATSAVVLNLSLPELADFEVHLVVEGQGELQRTRWRWRAETRRYDRVSPGTTVGWRGL